MTGTLCERDTLKDTRPTQKEERKAKTLNSQLPTSYKQHIRENERHLFLRREGMQVSLEGERNKRLAPGSPRTAVKDTLPEGAPPEGLIQISLSQNVLISFLMVLDK